MIHKLTTVFIVLLLLSPSSWARDIKIGVLNMQKLQEESPQIKDIMNRMQQRFEEPSKALVKMRDEIAKEEKEYTQNEVLMSPAKKKEVQKALVEKVKSFREKEVNLNKEMQTMRNQEFAVFQNKLTHLLNEMAKKEGFDLILTEGIVFVSDKLDITDKLLTKLKKDK